MSTAMTSLAPILRASATPISPTPPAPMTTTGSSCNVATTFFSAEYAVTPEQASGAAS